MKNGYLRKILSFTILFFVCMCLMFFPFNTAISEENIRETPIVKAVKKVKPAVVNISTKYKVYQKIRNPFHDPFF